MPTHVSPLHPGLNPVHKLNCPFPTESTSSGSEAGLFWDSHPRPELKGEERAGMGGMKEKRVEGTSEAPFTSEWG